MHRHSLVKRVRHLHTWHVRWRTENTLTKKNRLGLVHMQLWPTFERKMSSVVRLRLSQDIRGLFFHVAYSYKILLQLPKQQNDTSKRYSDSHCQYEQSECLEMDDYCIECRFLLHLLLCSSCCWHILLTQHRLFHKFLKFEGFFSSVRAVRCRPLHKDDYFLVHCPMISWSC